MELVIDGHINPKCKVETGIPQGSPVSPILFLIYISGVFLEIESRLPQVTCLLFMDDLGFLAAGQSVIKIKKILEKAGKITLNWGTRNAITYDISKTEAMLFSKARKQKLLEQLTTTELRFGGQFIRFNQKATRWMGMWLNSRLNFGPHFRERLKRAKTEEARIRGLSKTYGLPLALVRRIQIAAVQSVALYRAELWWKNQKTYQNEIQKLINRQARSITGMYSSTPVAALMSESGLIPAHILLDCWQRQYAYRLLNFPESISTKAILPITLRIGDGNAQPEDQPESDENWATHQKAKNFGQHLARQVSVGFCIDPADGVEPVMELRDEAFLGQIFIQEPTTAIFYAPSSYKRESRYMLIDCLVGTENLSDVRGRGCLCLPMKNRPAPVFR